MKILAALLLATTLAFAQAPAAPPAQGRGGGARRADYPEREAADPAVVARGKALYGVQCNFCHGSDARGGEGGPNLIRSPIVLNDQNGELITPIVQNGRPDRGMPKIDLTTAQVADVAAYIHAFKVGGRDISRKPPPSILVGDASAGEVYFKSKCAACHSPTGDLQGYGAKVSDAKALQQTWILPGARAGRGEGAIQTKVPPTTVTVTQASGEKMEGRLIRIDDFLVTVATPDGGQRTFRRDGAVPKVEVHDPLQPHKDLLRVYTDKEIHDLTAYLVTLK